MSRLLFLKCHTKFKNPCYTMRVSGAEDLDNSTFEEMMD